MVSWDFHQCYVCDQQSLRSISLRIRAVWSEPLLVAWIFYECSATDRTKFGVSKLKRRLHRLVWVYTCQNATLLEITFHDSFYLDSGGQGFIVFFYVKQVVFIIHQPLATVITLGIIALSWNWYKIYKWFNVVNVFIWNWWEKHRL